MSSTSKVDDKSSSNACLRGMQPGYSMALACGAGGATIGSIFGMPGVAVGGVVGGLIGWLANRNHAA